eukprot:8518719-Karenia_brevis.AAC.1
MRAYASEWKCVSSKWRASPQETVNIRKRLVDTNGISAFQYILIQREKQNVRLLGTPLHIDVDTLHV